MNSCHKLHNSAMQPTPETAQGDFRFSARFQKSLGDYSSPTLIPHSSLMFTSCIGGKSATSEAGAEPA